MAGDTVAVGANVTFAVTFTPSANATENAEIDITSDDPNMPSAAVKLTGLGAQPGLDVTPSPTLDFMMVQIGSQGKSSVKLTNSGRADLHIGSVKLSGAMASQFGDDAQAPLVLTANMSASFNVTYTPTMAGAGMATLEVDPTDTGLVPVMITLKGIGVSPQVSATPLMIDFGPIPLGQSAVAQVVTVRNGGVNPVVIDKLACANAAFGPPASNLGMMIPPKMSIDFMVTFSPTMDGLQNASLQFFLKDAVAPAAQVMVSGTGVAGVNKGGCTVGRGRARAMAPLALIGLFGLWLSRRRRRAG
jgi:hypothetical protein